MIGPFGGHSYATSGVNEIGVASLREETLPDSIVEKIIDREGRERGGLNFSERVGVWVQRTAEQVFLA